MDINKVIHIDNVKLREDGLAVVILDQSLLPNETIYLELEKPAEMYEAIQKLRVRGAPAIGICAAYSMYVLAARRGACEDFIGSLIEDGEYLKSSRPTAVNLAWAVDRMIGVAKDACKVADGAIGLISDDVQLQAIARLKDEAVAIHEEDKAMCRKIAEHGLSLVKDGDGILTHCNAGPLATSKYGTALGPTLR